MADSGIAPSKQDQALSWAPGTDPVSQASLWVPNRLYDWQVRVLSDCMQSGARVAVVTPNESGKTSTVIPAAGLAFMAAFPGAQVVSTAGVERQIREQLWPVLRSAVSRYPKWKMKDDDLMIEAPRIRGLPPSTWKAFTTKDPNYAEGFHSRWFLDEHGKLCYAPLMVIIDEAKSFEDYEFFHAFQRCDPDVWLVISTPGEDSGPFFDCFDVNKGHPWKTHEIGWNDCPHLRVGRKLRDRLEKIAQMGETSAFVMSWIFGKFFRRGTRLIFERMEDVDAAMSGLIRPTRGGRRAALDFSGGGDEAVCMIGEGNSVIDTVAVHEHDAMKLSDIFLARLRKYNVKPEDVIADNGGLGKPIIDYMVRKGFAGIQRYMADDKPRDPTLYVNRAAEDHFNVRWLLSEKLLRLQKDEVLRAQMRHRNYLMKNGDSNLIRCEPKEKMRDRGEKSPDRLDTVVMLFSNLNVDDVQADIKPTAKASRCGSVEEAMRMVRGEDEHGIWGRTHFQE